MKDPFFSIVIPTKDRVDLVEDLLISILDQDFDSYEIILSDKVGFDILYKVLA